MTTKTVSVQLIAMTGQYQKAMAGATASTAKLQGTSAAAGKSIGSVMGPTMALGAAVAAGAAVKMALDFDNAFTRIAAVTDTSTAQVGKWKEQVLSLAGTTAQSPQELAEALYFLASAGLDTSDVMSTLEMSAKASAVGLGETADIARLTANAINAYSESGLTAAQVTDTLVAAVREGTAEPDEFADAMGRILPIAAKAGITFDQVSASLAALSNIGLDVDEGVTAMRGVLVALLAPGKQAADTLDELGLSAEEVRRSLAEEGLIATLRMLEEVTGGNIDLLRKIVPNVRAMAGAFGLTGQEVAKVDDIFRDVMNSSGSLDKSLKTTKDSVGHKMRQAFVDLQVVLIQLGDTALPLVATTLGVVAQAAENARIKVAGFAQGVKTDINHIESFLNPAEKMRQNLVNIKEAFIGGTITGVQLDTVLDKLTGTSVLSAKGLDELRWMLEHTRGGFQQGSTEADRYRGDIDQIGGSATDAAPPVEGLGGAVKTAGDEMADAEKAAEDLTLALKTLTGIAFDVEDATLGWHQALIDVKKELREGAKTLGINTQAGIDNREAFKDAAEKALEHGEAVRLGGGSVKEAVNAVKDHVAQLRAEALAAGFSKGEVDKYIRTLNLTPKQISTLIRSNARSEAQQIEAYRAKLWSLHGMSVQTYVNTAFTQSREGNGHHAGGIVGTSGMKRYHGGGTLQGNEEWFIGQKGERVLSLAEMRTLRSIIGGAGSASTPSAPKGDGKDIRVAVRLDRRRFTNELDHDATYAGRWAS